MLRNRNLILAISLISVAVIVASVVWPLAAQRDASIDRAIESDFQDISQLVNDYFSDGRRLPDELSDLKLDDDAKARSEKYSYALEKRTSRSYKLCAEFKTDTKTGSESESYNDTTFSSSIYIPRQATHVAGYDCIEYEVYGYYGGGYEEPLFDSFDLDGSDESGGFDFEEESTDSSGATETQQL